MLDALFANGAWIFSVPALLGTGIFLIKLVMMLVGGSDDLDLGGDASSADAGHMHDVGMDGSHGDAHHGHGHNALMAVASVQGVSAFAMGFGWAGLGAMNGMKWGMPASMAIGVLGGIGMAGLFVLLISGVRSLQSSGTTNVANSVGSECEVYATVPPKGAGRGQVKVIVQGRMRIVQATQEGETPIATSTRVKVNRANADGTVVVG
ncbi:MAG TPA: hypothetical protein VK157_14705 [Phycisphaerales bacterium]|nr:hypothetical protein [Phycisphaerales bacterium]